MDSLDSTDATDTTKAGSAGESGPAPTAKKASARKSPAKKTAAKKSAAKKAPAAESTAPAAEGTAAPARSAKRAAKKTAAKPARKKAAATGDADGDVPAPDIAGTPDRSAQSTEAPAPSFGVLFQAPEPAAPTRRRRASAPAQAPSERPARDEHPDAVSGSTDAPADTSGRTSEAPDIERKASRGRGSRGRASQAAASGSDVEQPAAESDEQSGTEQGPEGEGAEDQGDAARRRRRRGGRGRRGRGADTEDGTGAEQDRSDDGSRSAAPSGSEDEDDQDSETGSSRRRRRRRRGGSGDEGDNPPGTVTRVRAPRREREEPTAVKGSTRLEAKKQRRREGREAGRRRTIITEAEFLARRESVDRVMVVRGLGDRTQIGVLEDGVLVEHYVSRETTASMAGNVYLGRVQNVLPSMEAAFVDIGKGRNAVLYAGEVNWDAAGLDSNAPKRIESALSSGDTVLVQVTKDPIGHKGARLTSQVSLPGRYLVYVPEGSMTGISRKLPDTERARLKAILKEVVPDTAGVIVRTAAEGASEQELRADVERLTKAWAAIAKKAETAAAKKASAGGAPILLHGEPDLTVRVIRDVFTEDFSSLVVAGDTAWNQVSGYVDDVAPDLASRVTRWTSDEDVFSHFRIDEQLSKAMDRKVWLPSGGSLVIDRTEAMTVVDVNTGKFIGSGGNLEETVTKNNIEAAEEIVRQLRLRDVGGIIVIDFIDMVLEANRELVVRRLLECLGRDRTKHQVAEVTSLGLIQMTRKRVGSGLIEVFSETCEHCNGRGLIIHTEPVIKGSGGSGGSGDPGGNGGSRGGDRSRSRRSRSDSEAAAPVEEARVPGGPTPAQIAAAAHAAAVKGMSGEHDEDDVAELVSTAGGAFEDDVAVSLDADAVPGSEPVEATDAATVHEIDSVSDDHRFDEYEIEPMHPAVRTRRKRGRVVAPAGPPRPLAEVAAQGDPPESAAHPDQESHPTDLEGDQHDR